jgi:hypothetical protein
VLQHFLLPNHRENCGFILSFQIMHMIIVSGNMLIEECSIPNIDRELINSIAARALR